MERYALLIATAAITRRMMHVITIQRLKAEQIACETFLFIEDNREFFPVINAVHDIKVFRKKVLKSI